MKLYPDNIEEVTEYDVVKDMLKSECMSDWARQQSIELNPIENKKTIAKRLDQVYEYAKIIGSGITTPEIFTLSMDRVLSLLSKDGAALELSQVRNIRACVSLYSDWRDWLAESQIQYPVLFELIPSQDDVKIVIQIIDEVLDANGNIKDDATEKLAQLRVEIIKIRKQIAITFERELRKAKKNKQSADPSESYINGRRLLSVLAEYKRQIQGTIHGESETHKTVYIEPLSTIPLNAELENLQSEERTEVRKILRTLTTNLSDYLSLIKKTSIKHYVLDFIRAKASLARSMEATRPKISTHAIIHLRRAYHPLLKLKNEKTGEETVPIDIDITQQHKIIVISGPNAGGKTVSLKTVMLQQMMFQSGLLIPADPSSELGIFQEIFAQIGDAQSIDLKLSTYSAHLQNMKYLLQSAGPRTLFCIDELGSGSDPHLGGVFAEVILERLAETRSRGIVTTHYLNLKTLAEKNPHMTNAAMVFDEKELKPLFKFAMGKPGSSFTFSIAERVGIESELINKAKALVKEEHYQLEHLLRETEKRMQDLVAKEKEIERLEKKYEDEIDRFKKLSDREEFKRQERMLSLQNEIKQDEIKEYKQLERKLKQLIQEWRKADDKGSVLKNADKLLSDQKIKRSNKILESKMDKIYQKTHKKLQPGELVMNTQNSQVGEIISIENNTAKVKIGNLPFSMDIDKLITVKLRPAKKKHRKKKDNPGKG